MKTRTFKGGIHPGYNKELTEKIPLTFARLPDRVVIPLQQHIGAPCKPLVEAGDTVKAGQKIADSQGFVSAPVHSSISGKVLSIEPHAHPLGIEVNSIIIESDGAGEWTDGIHPPGPLGELSREEIINIIKEAGIVGMGGATFPTHVKLSPPPEKKIDTVVLNGAECEPYLTADHRVMVEEAEEVVFGLKVFMKVLGASRGVIGIEDNKPDAIRAIQEQIPRGEDISVIPLSTCYPQGAEKMLIKATTGRSVPSGGLPLDVGVVNQNVGTSVAVARALREGKPLIERVVTVTGSAINMPANLIVKIGTPVRDIVEQCGGVAGDVRKIILGGPMMGLAQPTLDVPVIKGTSGILVLGDSDVILEEAGPCIRCSRCINVCPLNLLPNFLGTAGERNRLDQAEKYHALDCMECGSCAYICPARRPLTQWIRVAKSRIQARNKKG